MKIKYKIMLMMLLCVTISNAQKYDIDSFIELVKKNNKDIMIAAKELEIAETQDAQARSGAYPQLSASAGYNRHLKEAFLFVDFGSLMGGGEAESAGPQKFKINYNNEFNAKAVLSQQVFNYTVFTAIKAAKQYKKLTNYAYDASLQGIINGSKKAFYQTLLLKEVWMVNADAEKNAKENYLTLKNKFEAGLISEFELLQGEVRWQNYIPNVTQSERNYNLALNSLRTLTGISHDIDFEITGELMKPAEKPQNLEFKDILSNRPDYNALLLEKQLRETNIDVEYSGHFPSIYASLAYQYSAQSDIFKLERQNNYLIAGLTLNIPIFNGWNTDAKVQKAKIEADQTEIQLSKFESEIHTQIQNLNLKLIETGKRIASAESAMNTAKKAFEIANTSADNGLATQLELKDAGVGLEQAKLNYYFALYDYLEAYYDWELALGISK